MRLNRCASADSVAGIMAQNTKTFVLTALLALVCGFLGAAGWAYSGLGDARTEAWLVDNPEVLPKMAEELQRRDTEARLASISGELAEPFPGTVLGNPQGSKTLVEFSDYNCGYCKMSQVDVAKLIATDPDLKIVIKEWPIFQGSETAARMALAAAKQGKYRSFHEAMFEFSPVSEESIAAAAERAGLDLERARRDAGAQDISLELARNAAAAQQLGFSGTPSWVTKDAVFEGAVGYDRLKDAIDGQEGAAGQDS